MGFNLGFKGLILYTFLLVYKCCAPFASHLSLFNHSNNIWSKTKLVNVVCFLLDNSQASEFYMPTFRNTLSVQSSYAYPSMKMEQTEWSETLAYKIQKPRNYPEESIQHTEHGESLKSRKILKLLIMKVFHPHVPYVLAADSILLSTFISNSSV